MCEFISWKQGSDGTVYFLTDNDVFSSFGRKVLKGSKDNDILGHGAIDAFFNQRTITMEQFECRNFWEKDQFPPEIAVHLESPETLIKTWGKMLKQALRPDDIQYILDNAPKTWEKALVDLCIECMARDAECALAILQGIQNLTEEQKSFLVKGAARDTECAFAALQDIKNLTEEQKGILIKGAVRNSEYAYFTLRYIENLTEEQKNLLIKSVVRDAVYAHSALRNLENLTKEQRALLMKKG